VAGDRVISAVTHFGGAAGAGVSAAAAPAAISTSTIVIATVRIAFLHSAVSLKGVEAIGNDINNVVVISGMTFAMQQRDKLSMLGRLRTLLGSAPRPPKLPRSVPATWSGRADANRSHAKSEFGKRGRAKQS
jgi:hypothetical protein